MRQCTNEKEGDYGYGIADDRGNACSASDRMFVGTDPDGDNIVGGLGVIVNDFHNKKDLTPNVCAYIPKKNIKGKESQDIYCIQL